MLSKQLTQNSIFWLCPRQPQFLPQSMKILKKCFLWVPQASLHGGLRLVLLFSCPRYRVTFTPKSSGHHQCPLRVKCSLLRVQTLRQGHRVLKPLGPLLAKLLKLLHRNQGLIWVLGINLRGPPQCHPFSLLNRSPFLSGNETLLRRLVNTARLYLLFANFSDTFTRAWMLGELGLRALI